VEVMEGAKVSECVLYRGCLYFLTRYPGWDL